MSRTHHQKLPPSGAAREILREKGQFWTPQWVAEAMASYVLGSGATHVFDPAVGAGAFFLAAKRVAASQGRKIDLLGTEVDPVFREQAVMAGLSPSDICGVEIRDFVLCPPERRYDAVLANPPYIRHHRLSSETKSLLKHFATSLIGEALDGRAGYHVYFFLRALQALKRGGRLAIIMPADVCEGVFAQTLWSWILINYRLDAVITFASEATPFPGVDTNAVVFLICNDNPSETLEWGKCLSPDTDALSQWVASGFNRGAAEIDAVTRSVHEGLQTGLSRPPSDCLRSGPVLGDFARTMRGIATGANDFFFLTREQANELDISIDWLVPAIGRTRDVTGEVITPETLQLLRDGGRPTLLLSLDATSSEKLPASLRRYIKRGEELGLSKRALIASRQPWYKMETRAIPPFLFAYLGRRNARFIRNLAGVVPLTGFLCVYPIRSDAAFISRLWNILCDPETISNLGLVGKSYGSGALKVEPRALERLPIPASVLDRWGLAWKKSPEQLELLAS